MPYHAAAWVEAFAEVGVNMLPEQIYDIEGSNHIGVIKRIFSGNDMTPSEDQIDSIADRKRELFFEFDKSKAFAGMQQCLNDLKSTYSLALVSGSTRKIVDELVASFYPETFDVVISGSDVLNGKPAPDPFLKAMGMLDVSPERCVIVENAPLGVEAAKNAGAFCIAVPTYVDPATLKKADIIVADHSELLRYLYSLL
ncbi:HAD superfamily hydrolase (TIGR01509 family) [Methanohalophilus levihalophilus]|nr:HAD superfamily hydrolase (TIGR01509 family) [Methanohalophilus levihalophilus]